MTAWLGVVSRAHVQQGVAGRFAQLCHGKAQPLRRMRRGDWLVYYSPTIEMGGTALRAFTAIGQVEGEEAYTHDMGGGFVPYRRDVRYAEAKEVALDMIKESWRSVRVPTGGWRFAAVTFRLMLPTSPPLQPPWACERRLNLGWGGMKRGPKAQPLPTRLSGPAESPGFLLWKISNAWQRRQRLALGPFGLTHSQFVVLATATWFGAAETLTQSRISQLSGIDPMTTSQVLRALEAAALIERVDHPTDPRAKSIMVTRAGRDLARKAIVVVEETDAAFFEPLAADTARLVKMFQALVQGNERTDAEENMSANNENGRRSAGRPKYSIYGSRSDRGGDPLLQLRFGAAPTWREAISPPLKIIRVGIDITPYFEAVFGLSSTLSFTILTLSPIAPEISSSAGAIMRQGPHHSAQKSTTTGPVALSTSASKSASETLPTAMGVPRSVGKQGADENRARDDRANL